MLKRRTQVPAHTRKDKQLSGDGDKDVDRKAKRDAGGSEDKQRPSAQRDVAEIHLIQGCGLGDGLEGELGRRDGAAEERARDAQVAGRGVRQAGEDVDGCGARRGEGRRRAAAARDAGREAAERGEERRRRREREVACGHRAGPGRRAARGGGRDDARDGGAAGAPARGERAAWDERCAGERRRGY